MSELLHGWNTGWIIGYESGVFLGVDFLDACDKGITFGVYTGTRPL